MFSRLERWMAMLRTDPLGFIVYLLYFSVSILLSLILHECAHGYVALRCGDPTAKMLGRLTLDPRKHLDPMGTICMIFLGFGWARPVPVNPRNFSNYHRDDFLVSIAGITMNMLLFIFCAALSVGITRLMVTDELWQAFAGGGQSKENLYYFVLSQSESGISAEYADWFARPGLQYLQRFLYYMMSINLSLAVFNFLPIPPLDGYHLLNDTLLRGRLQLNAQTFRIAQLILMFVALSGMLSRIISVAVDAVWDAVIHLLLLI